jgi:hypothetical protein
MSAAARPCLVAALLLSALAACVGAASPGAAPGGEAPPDGPAASAAAARKRAETLAERGGPYTAEEAREVLGLALGDPGRFASDGELRARVLELLPGVLPEGAPAALRDRLLHELATGPGLTFPQSEALELAWGAAERPSAGREAELAPGRVALPDELTHPVAASILSFPSAYLEPENAARLLAALRRAAPGRELVVLADLPMREALAELTAGLEAAGGVHWIDTHGRPYSPWPRDPFTTARLPDGGLVLVERPAYQGGREGDRWMAREVIQNLPPFLDRAWGGEAGVRWGEAPFFFHNGHVLMAGGAAWTSLHGLEREALEALGLDRVPVETFGTVEGIDRYLAAARRAMDEMTAFYGVPVRLVHPLPDSASGAGGLPERVAEMRAIGGGAGFDLDSLVTFLPGPGGAGEGGGLQALVGDLDLGRELLGALGPEDRESLRATYGFRPPAGELPGALAAFQGSPRAAGLDAFLDLAAGKLTRLGVPVRRLPLLLAPVALLEDRESYPHEDFVIGWQNAVFDPHPGGLRAEAFASGVSTGDARAVAAYQEAGAELVLLPPLVRSVILNGGLRCASSQVRAAEPVLESPDPRPTLSESR